VSAAEATFGGHLKYFYTYTNFPDDSALSALADPYRESLGNMRLKAEYRSGNWDGQVHYVLNGLYSNDLSDCALRGGIIGSGCGRLSSDHEQLFDLSSVISESDDSIVYQRLDRLVLAYSTENMVARFGRQSISWGNGMVYNPLDLFNPFPPEAIDTEYKSGDDMLYMQGLLSSGNDLQLLLIPRRKISTGELSSTESALAGKYHRLGTDYEIDLLAAINYGDQIVGAAYTGEINENVLNASLTLTRTDINEYWSAAANYNFSTVLSNRNLTGFVELFYNGFGLSGDRYSVQDVIEREDLFVRLLRGEIFTIGRFYLATGGSLELTPLFNLTPTLFVNLGDQSGLLQFSGTYSLKQNIDLLAGVNLPAGADGTEYGGIYDITPGEEQLLAPGRTLFARLAWYF
jgi:hypothetical protein